MKRSLQRETGIGSWKCGCTRYFLAPGHYHVSLIQVGQDGQTPVYRSGELKEKEVMGWVHEVGSRIHDGEHLTNFYRDEKQVVQCTRECASCTIFTILLC